MIKRDTQSDHLVNLQWFILDRVPLRKLGRVSFAVLG